MKTTKEIAELFCNELDRAAKGEVRKDVIVALEKCSNSMIKLARLEMDFAFRNWGEQPPNVPWIASKPMTLPAPVETSAAVPTTAHQAIKDHKSKLEQNKRERAEAKRDSESES